MNTNTNTGYLSDKDLETLKMIVETGPCHLSAFPKDLVPSKNVLVNKGLVAQVVLRQIEDNVAATHAGAMAYRKQFGAIKVKSNRAD